MKTFNFETYRVELGQSAQENSDIVRRSKQNDIWLHLASGSSPHAVIQSNGKKISRSVLYQAAQQVKDYSQRYTMFN